MKHKYAVFSIDNCEVKGTNSDQDAWDYADCDDFLVVNLETGKEVTPNGGSIDLEPMQEIERE